MNELSYSLGASVAFNLKSQGIKIESIGDFMQALEGVLADTPLALTDEKIGEILNTYFKELQDKTIAAIKEQGNIFFAENAKREGGIGLEIGLQ